MSKGSKRRPAAVSEATIADAWDRIFRRPLIQAICEDIRREQEARYITGEPPDEVDLEREAWMREQEDLALQRAKAEP